MDSLKKKDSVKAKTIPKARKRNAENDMNKNAKRQSICSLHEVVDETEINQDPEKPGKVTKVIYYFIVVYSLHLYIYTRFTFKDRLELRTN